MKRVMPAFSVLSLCFAVAAATLANANDANKAPSAADQYADEHAGHDHAPGEGHGPGDGHAHDAVHARPGFDFSVWEAVPIQTDGLEKTLYTFSKDLMREATGKVQYGDRHPIENVFSMAFEPEMWVTEPLLKVRHPKLKEVFGGGKHPRISFLQLEQHRDQWVPLAQGAKDIETELNNMLQKLSLIFDLNSNETLNSAVASKLLIVPAVDFRGDKTEWKTVDQMAMWTKAKSQSEEDLVNAYNRARVAFLAEDAAAFNQASAEAVAALNALDVPTFKPAWKFKLDRWDSKVGLFNIAAWVYLLSALIFMGSYLSGKQKTSKIVTVAATSTLALGAVIHIAALTVRGILAGRTPVANLFESAVFIIGCMTVLALVFSLYYKTRIPGLAGAALGAFFMGIANNIPLHYGGKVLPLIDALQSYWLHIHVTMMLASYACFALAFFVAGAYVVRALLMRAKPGFVAADDSILQYLDSLNFRIITVGLPLLTGGVILGAVWAAEAWGRPWAFDPKETAAAMTWMVYVIYLHCRLFLGWRGMRGILLSILGFVAVLFTYLGVSFFLPGLHSYVSDGMSFGDFLKKIIPGI